jgi:hypothetical protein
VAGVEHGHVISGGEQGRGHMGADEAGSAGHEYVGHPPTVGLRTGVYAVSRPPVRGS